MQTNRSRSWHLKRLGQFVFTAFHLALIGFGICLMIGPIITAQTPETRVILENLKSEIKEIKDQHLESRLAVVEAIQQQQLGWMQANASGTGLLLVGGAFTVLKRRKGGE